MNSAVASQAEKIEQADVPAWVDLIDWQNLEAVEPSEGVIYLLSDTQVNATAPSHCRFHRVVSKADSSAGLASIASFNLTFDPTWEQVKFHFLRLWRSGQLVWEGSIGDFQVLQRERGLERRLYDGRLTGDVLIHDVRVGDIVDVAYSIEGLAPTTGDRIALNWRLSWSAACALSHCRLRVLDGRDLRIRLGNNAPEAVVTAQDGYCDYVWKLRSEKPDVLEFSTPIGYGPERFLEVSDACTWGDVSDLFRALYTQSVDLPADLQTLVDEIAATYHDDQDKRIMEALRLVQREVRYLALSMGTGGLIPRSNEDIWTSRFGDCKDKSQLLTTILRSWQLDACPALVNSYRRGDVKTSDPNIYAFDHCIVRLNLDGVIHYFDGTQLPQAGTLATATKLDFGFALPLMPNSDLEALPAIPVVHVVEANENWQFAAQPEDPAQLVVKTIWRSWYADGARNRLLQDGAERVAREYQDFYDRRYGGVTCASPTQFLDDPTLNALTIIETYQVTKPFVLPDSGNGLAEFTLKVEEPWPDMYSQETTQRLAPFDLGLPRKKTRRVSVVFDMPVGFETQAEEVKSTGWQYINNWEAYDPFSMSILEEYHVEGGMIEAASVNKTMTDLQKANKISGFTCRLEAANGKIKIAKAPSTGPSISNFWWVWPALWLGIFGLRHLFQE